ncbi:hypothetical protein F511_16035 [Dorcoceras hygrometricum]|uniref:Uncharacterized protein n=1 Tax=Dorcoceras hygrometricum TaxID=472368 RepID=A0A2Z7D2Z5_9LAMI|nr:hypothetical protein F511_16035 [Dorcoceras hygrometricum]
MSLFDLQDVCIVIGSIETLDLPMIVDLIGIYVLKGPYCTLTTTNWFLQPPYYTLGRPSSPSTSRRLAPPCAAAVCRHLRDRTCFDHRDEGFPYVLNSSVRLVQADEGVLIPVVDLIKRIYRRLQFKSQISLRILVGARRLDSSKGQFLISAAPPRKRDPDPPLSPTDATRIHGQAHIIEGVMYVGKLYTSLTLAMSWLELPLTLAHIIGDVKGTVLHNSTLMGHLDT